MGETEVKERPILFNGEMVRAILDGRKTETRRVVKPQPSGNHPGVYADLYNKGPEWAFWLPDNRMTEPRTWKCPYGAPGDRLWVRETWGLTPDLDSQLKDDGLTPKDIDLDDAMHVGYRADDSGAYAVKRWRPSIHMPRWASRITLEVKAVRVERVQTMSRRDFADEGFDGSIPLWKSVFKSLWDTINAKRGYSWDSNPFVWVVEFEVIDV